MREGHHKVAYRAMPAHSRFGLFSPLLHHEICYTAEELSFRERVLTLRADSRLNPELLQTSNSWFLQDADAALINVNANSWVYGDEFRPRHMLSNEDFHIDLVDVERLHWLPLSKLMRHIGDYLLLRNSELSPEYHNQPMNYVLLDVVQILKRLSVIENEDFVAEQLQLLRSYLRAVEIHVSYAEGSDRLFLADCRNVIEKTVDVDIEQQRHTQRLKQRFQDLQKQLYKLAELRHTVLHFALSGNVVNQHPYWEDFVAAEQKSISNAEFPTLAAKACAKSDTDSLALTATRQTEQSLPILELSEQQLMDCPDFKFIDGLTSEARDAYGSSVADLQEILRFQRILDQFFQLFDQAGEVFTLLQFREQMLSLLASIEQFVVRSKKSVLDVLEVNAKIYHHFIQEKQDMSWMSKFLSNKQEVIKKYINNQDNLARFSATPTDLNHVTKELVRQIGQTTNEITQYASKTKQLELINSSRVLAEQLLDSMHVWVSHQRALQGLPEVEKPLLFQQDDCMSTLLNDVAENKQPTPIGSISPEEAQPLINEPMVMQTPAPSNTFFAGSTYLPLDYQRPIGGTLIELPQLERLPDSGGERAAEAPVNVGINNSLVWGVVLLPVGFLAVYLIYMRFKSSEPQEEVLHEPIRYQRKKVKVEDVLAKLLAMSVQDKDWNDSIEDFQSDFNKLEAKARQGLCDAEGMKTLLEDINDFISDYLEHVTNKIDLRKTII